MIRTFCDVCNKEITKTADGTRFQKTFNGTRVCVTTTVTVNEAGNGHICVPCLQTTVIGGEVVKMPWDKAAEREGKGYCFCGDMAEPGRVVCASHDEPP